MGRLLPQPPANLDQAAASILEPEALPEAVEFLTGELIALVPQGSIASHPTCWAGFRKATRSCGRRVGPHMSGIDVISPKSIIPALQLHMAKFVGPEPGALVFCGPSGAPLRRSNFGKMSGWPHAVRSIGVEGLHFHDLRHTGNTFAAAGGAGIKDLMARMGHDSERAALIYQHQARGADKIITGNIDAHVEAERGRKDDDDGTAGVLVPVG